MVDTTQYSFFFDETYTLEPCLQFSQVGILKILYYGFTCIHVGQRNLIPNTNESDLDTPKIEFQTELGSCLPKILPRDKLHFNINLLARNVLVRMYPYDYGLHNAQLIVADSRQVISTINNTNQPTTYLLCNYLTTDNRITVNRTQENPAIFLPVAWQRIYHFGVLTTNLFQ